MVSSSVGIAPDVRTSLRNTPNLPQTADPAVCARARRRHGRRAPAGCTARLEALGHEAELLPLLELETQRPDADAERLGRPLPVTVEAAEGLDDRLPLDLLEGPDLAPGRDRQRRGDTAHPRGRRPGLALENADLRDHALRRGHAA